MSDSDQSLKVLVQIASEGGEKAVADVQGVKTATEQLTAGQTNLASGIPNLTANTDQYVIASEAEYRAIQKTYDAVTAKIPVMLAAGKSADELKKAQAALNDTLSTEQAILIAEQIETKAAAAAALEKAAADKVAALAAEESTAANHINALSMRELVVIGRELGRGDYSRLAGSATLLAQSFGALQMLMNPMVIGIAALAGAAYELHKHLSAVNEELDKTLDKLQADAFKQHEESVRAISDAWHDAAEAQAAYQAAMLTAGQDNDPVETQIKNVKELESAQIDASKRIIEALGKQEVAYLRARGATPEQIAAAEANTANKIAGLDVQREKSQGIEALKSEQTQRQAAAAGLDASEQTTAAAKQQADEAEKLAEQKLQKAQDALNPSKDGSDPLARQAVAQAALDKAKAAPNSVVLPGQITPTDMTQVNQMQIASAQAALDRVTKEIANDNKAIPLAKNQVQAALDNQKIADEAAKKAVAASERNQARLGQLPGEISQAQSVDRAKDFGADAAALMNTHLANSNLTLGALFAAAKTNVEAQNNILNGLLSHAYSQQAVLAALQGKVNQLHRTNGQ